MFNILGGDVSNVALQKHTHLGLCVSGQFHIMEQCVYNDRGIRAILLLPAGHTTFISIQTVHSVRISVMCVQETKTPAYHLTLAYVYCILLDVLNVITTRVITTQGACDNLIRSSLDVSTNMVLKQEEGHQFSALGCMVVR